MLPVPPFHPPDAASTAAFVVLVLVVAGLGVAGVASGSARSGADGVVVRRRGVGAGVFAAIWLGLTALAPASGLVGAAPAAMMAFFVGSNAFGLGVALSRAGRWLANLPLAALVGFHAFRLPLEIILHRWALQGSIPIDMSWSGRNYDVVTGLAAVVACGWLVARPGDRFVAGGFTALGLGLLLNVARVALSCAPVALPIHVDCDPPLLLALHAPYAWIVSVCVAGALCAHVVALRSLASR